VAGSSYALSVRAKKWLLRFSQTTTQRNCAKPVFELLSNLFPLALLFLPGWRRVLLLPVLFHACWIFYAGLTGRFEWSAYQSHLSDTAERVFPRPRGFFVQVKLWADEACLVGVGAGAIIFLRNGIPLQARI